MADLAQLETALRNADAAGDVAAARQLAQAIRQARTRPQPAPTSWQQRLMQNAAAGLVRGAGSIGATLATPYDLFAGNTKSIGNPERRGDMDLALQWLGADPESWQYQVGKLGGEIAGTAGVGPLLAGAGRAVPAIASRAGPALEALGTYGMRAGGLTGAAGMGVRTGAAGVAGGAAAGLVSPEDALLGAGIGALIPGGVAGAGALGRTLAKPFRSPDKKAAEALLKALESDPQVLAAKLRAAQQIVPGSTPTVAQTLRSPQASTLERIVSESPGGAALKEQYLAQNAARLGALDRVAPVDPRGFRSAQQDLGEASLAAIRGGDKSARSATSAAYQSIPQDEAALYLPDLAAVRDQYFPRGAFGGRAAADQAVSVADQIGNLIVPADKAGKAAKEGLDIVQAMRKAGGLSITNNSGRRGEVQMVGENFKNLVRKNGGKSPAQMAEYLQQRGYLKTDTLDELFDALDSARGGGYTGSVFDDTAAAWGAARDASMGPPSGAMKMRQKVTLGEFDALRKSIGNAQRAAGRDPERATEGLALGKMKSSLDDRLNQVVAGDGAADEVLPIEWADALTAAQRLKRAQVEKFRTGPQAYAFRTGPDGMPSVQGGEFAPKVWGQRPGIAADIKQFRKVADDHPQLLGQFRAMITTEGGGTATQGGNLTGKFVRWVDNSLPGLEASFDKAEVQALRRIAADIKRAEVAAAVGAARGSPTFQNASNALSLGLLDSPLVNIAANRIPIVNNFAGPALGALRESGRNAKARSMAGLLGDPNRAADAISSLFDPGFVDLLGVQRGLLTTAPILGAQ